MNQPNLSVMAPKTATAISEAPDVLSLLRRYAWLLIAGAVVGAGASTAGYFYVNRTMRQFTASVPFQVLPPSPSIVAEPGSAPQVTFTPDDASQVINRQVFIFQQEKFLDDVLRSAEFHPADRPNQECQWLADNKSNPMKAIKRDLRVVPRISAASFEVTMTARDPAEAHSLALAAIKVYKERLNSDSMRRKTQFVKSLEDARRTAEANFLVLTDTLREYARINGIDVLKSRFDIEKAALQELNRDFTMANAAASNAEQQKEALKKQRTDGQEIKLSPEIQQSVEYDSTLKGLAYSRLQWEQEQVAEFAKRPLNQQALAAIEARLEEIDKQLKDTRIKLTEDALARMEKMLADEAANKRYLADFIGTERLKREESVTKIGQNLLVWDQRVDEVKEAQERVKKLRSQMETANANRATDDTRVAQLDEPLRPTQPSWPKWYMFIPTGTLAGLGLSALLAYLFVLTDTRVRTPRDISRTLQLPLLGFVPDEGDDRMLNGSVETAILTSPASMVAESFRQIRGNITAQTVHNPVGSIVVASIAPGGGSSTVASNLAASMALNELRVLLVDANFYRPSLDRIYKGLPSEGLTDAVADPAVADRCIMPHPSLSRLHLMGVGSGLAGASSEVFESKAFRELLDRLKTRYDLVIFDGAPFNLVADSLALASRVDGVVPVVRGGQVSRGAVSRVRDQLRAVHGNLLGFVLNAAQTSNTGYFKENYRSFYRYAGDGARARSK